MSPRLWNLIQVHVAVVLFGLAGVLGKLLDSFSPVVIVFGRTVLAALTLLVVSLVWRLPLWPRSWRDLLVFVALGVLLAVHWATFFQSVQVSSVTIALITYSTFPVFVALLEPPLLREHLHTSDVILALLALLGVGILVEHFEVTNLATQGVLWGVASGLTFALLSVLNRKYVRQHAGITIALYQDAVAAAVTLPFAVWQSRALTADDVGNFLLLGILCTAVAHSLFIAGMRTVTARTASMIACLEPVYGAVLAVVRLGEVVSVRTLVGGMIVVGVAFYSTFRAGMGTEEEQKKEV
jgi:drug/metabolite transporter (DMT)-like permease